MISIQFWSNWNWTHFLSLIQNVIGAMHGPCSEWFEWKVEERKHMVFVDDILPHACRQGCAICQNKANSAQHQWQLLVASALQFASLLNARVCAFSHKISIVNLKIEKWVKHGFFCQCSFKFVFICHQLQSANLQPRLTCNNNSSNQTTWKWPCSNNQTAQLWQRHWHDETSPWMPVRKKHRCPFFALQWIEFWIAVLKEWEVNQEFPWRIPSSLPSFVVSSSLLICSQDSHVTTTAATRQLENDHAATMKQHNFDIDIGTSHELKFVFIVF